MARGPPSLDTAPDTTFKGGSRPKSEEQPHAIAGRSLGNYAASWCSGPGGISGCNGLSAAAIERVALTKTWVLDKLIETSIARTGPGGPPAREARAGGR